ncbi:MAG: FAD-binding oxidoreductase [Firmicutes bacterium]|nr:FAD-binding oxidoreductase [Bacillota bacterium]
MKKSASIVIIGAGISGASIAYELAKRGQKDIVVIEKRYEASGATGRCGAGVRMQWGTEMNCRLTKYSIERFEKLQQELDYEYDIEFHQGGYLMCAGTEKEFEQFKKNVILQNSLGIPSRVIDQKQAKEIIPYINTDHMVGGTFCPKDGFLNPFHTTLAYMRAAEKLGVTVYKYTEVTGIDKKGDKIVGVQTDKGYIQTNIVVNAAGGYSSKIAAMCGVNLPLYSIRRQILVTEPVVPIQSPMFMGFVHNIYCQQTPHGSFIMGHGSDLEPTDLNTSASWNFLVTQAKRCAKLLPPLKDLNIVRQWAGLYNMSLDRQPIYDKVPGVEGMYLAAGYSGHGFMLGPATGVVMAEMILGQKPTVDVSMLSYDRFEKGNLVLEPSVV